MLLVTTHPLHEQALRGAAATLRVVLRDDPRALRTPGRTGGPAAARAIVAAELVETTAGAHTWHGGGRVLLLAPAEGWLGLLPGQNVTAEGLLAPPERADLTIAVLRVRGAPRDVTAPPWWQSGAGGLRAGLRAAAGTLAPAEAGLLPGLAIGDTSALTSEVEDDFRAAGLTHLLAVSGANLAILTGAVLAGLRRLRADPRLSAAVAGAVLVGFVILARPSPSVVRAAVMGAVTLGGARRGAAAVRTACARRCRARPAVRRSRARGRRGVRAVGVGHRGARAAGAAVGGGAGGARRAAPRRRGARGACGRLPRDSTARRRARWVGQPRRGRRQPARGTCRRARHGAGRAGRAHRAWPRPRWQARAPGWPDGPPRG